MTPEQFAYWMQGFAELSQSPPNQDQWNAIRAHLRTVFTKVTPSGPLDPEPVHPLIPGWPPVPPAPFPPFTITC